VQPWIYYGETLQVGTYPAVIVAGFCLCTMVLRREALFSGLAPRLVMDAALVGIVAGGICARLFHAIVEQPALYWSDPALLLSTRSPRCEF
jgi:prolipoprotein diacylglyceryltransferase